MTISNQYRVDGMTCGGCAKSVTAAIERAAPGTSVEVDLDNKLAIVSGAHDSSTIEQAVEDAGFDFGGAVTP